jgi:ABC-type transporter Mla MlaB component
MISGARQDGIRTLYPISSASLLHQNKETKSKLHQNTSEDAQKTPKSKEKVASWLGTVVSSLDLFCLVLVLALSRCYNKMLHAVIITFTMKSLNTLFKSQRLGKWT